MNNVTFDSNTYYLGRLCKQLHQWGEQGKSLRYLKDKHCAECHKERSKAYYVKHRSYIADRQAKYYIDNKDKLIRQQLKYRLKNIDKINKYFVNYRIQNREKLKLVDSRRSQFPKRQLQNRIKASNRRATKKLNHSCKYTLEQVNQRFQLFDGLCAYCSSIAESIDHVIPISMGGSDVLGNLLPSCQSCNSSKNSRNLETWYKASPNFTPARWKRILKVLGLTECTLGQIPLF